MRITRQILGLAGASLFAVAAQAQQIDFHGGILGCFYNVNPPYSLTSCTPSGANSIFDPYGTAGSLNYTGDVITGTTSGDISDNSVGFGTGTGGSFGHINLFSGDYTSLDGTFLELTFFFDPAFVPFALGTGTPTSATTPTYAALVKGNVHVDKSGNLKIDFGAPVTFKFTNGGHMATCDASGGLSSIPGNCGPGPYAGDATITVNDLNAFYGQTGVAITGQIAVSSVSPEPATLALFATGLVGLVPAIRYRRRKNNV